MHRIQREKEEAERKRRQEEAGGPGVSSGSGHEGGETGEDKKPMSLEEIREILRKNLPGVDLSAALPVLLSSLSRWQAVS